MLSKLRNILKDCWKELLIITSISIILSLLFLLLFNLQPNKKIITNNIAKKNKKIFTSEFNHEFISDNERIIIVKNEDIIKS